MKLPAVMKNIATNKRYPNITSRVWKSRYFTSEGDDRKTMWDCC